MNVDLMYINFRTIRPDPPYMRCPIHQTHTHMPSLDTYSTLVCSRNSLPRRCLDSPHDRLSVLKCYVSHTAHGQQASYTTLLDASTMYETPASTSLACTSSQTPLWALPKRVRLLRARRTRIVERGWVWGRAAPGLHMRARGAPHRPPGFPRTCYWVVEDV